MSRKLSLKDLALSGKKVLMRVDFNVPLDKSHHIIDDSRLKAAIPSIQYILDQGGAVILMSHLGRPTESRIPDFSLAPCGRRLSELLKKPVIMAPDCIGKTTQELVSQLKPGQILLLENLRFHRGEENPEENPSFARQLASLADFYVNDAFGSAHRAHASIVDITSYFPNKAAAGLLMEKEIEFLGPALLNPQKPLYAIIGGAKISTKIGVIKTLLTKVDALFIGGGMSYTFMKAQGISIGSSIHEDLFLEEAKAILKMIKGSSCKLFLPIDIVVADRFSNNADIQIVDFKNGIPAGYQGMDIGPKTIELYLNELKNAATIFWNGPVGVFEFSNFAKGTNCIAQGLAKLPAVTIVGGGESVAAIQAAGVSDKITHISTGGGASLEFIEFGQLPGIEALSDSVTYVEH